MQPQITAPATDAIVTPDFLLKHWQGHRALTRRVIDAFPEDELFNFSIGGMRPFSELAGEAIRMAVPTLRGIVSREWVPEGRTKPTTKSEILGMWDDDTAEIERLWPQIPPGRWQEVDKAFGQWEGTGTWILFYIIDNEIHHRGQGYVYLRALGIEPPGFWDRP